MQLMGFSFVRELKELSLSLFECTDSHHLYTAKRQENEATFGDMTLVYNLCFSLINGPMLEKCLRSHGKLESIYFMI